jgi:glutathione S-transferase
MKIYGDLKSGNCLKVKWTAERLGLPFDWVDIDIMQGGSRKPAYLAKFPQGQVPAVELDDGRCLAQSNAIIRYLARGSALLPDDGWTQARIDEWLFWEQYSHEPYIATTRYHVVYLKRSMEQREAWRVERGEKALDFMESQLRGQTHGPDPVPRSFLVGNSLTIADIALVAYTRLAHEGGFDLGPRPAVRAWIGRVEKGLGLPQVVA